MGKVKSVRTNKDERGYLNTLRYVDSATVYDNDSKWDSLISKGLCEIKNEDNKNIVVMTNLGRSIEHPELYIIPNGFNCVYDSIKDAGLKARDKMNAVYLDMLNVLSNHRATNFTPKDIETSDIFYFSGYQFRHHVHIRGDKDLDLTLQIVLDTSYKHVYKDATDKGISYYLKPYFQIEYYTNYIKFVELSVNQFSNLKWFITDMENMLKGHDCQFIHYKSYY